MDPEGPPGVGRLRLRLYVAGATPASERARVSVESLAASLPPGSFALEVIDALSDPERAERDNVIAAPLLVKDAPEPTVRLIGDLADPQRLRTALRLREESAEPPSAAAARDEGSQRPADSGRADRGSIEA